MATIVANLMFDQKEVTLKNVTIGRALVLSDERVKVQTIVTPNGEQFDFEIASRSAQGPEGDWVQHAMGTLERRLPSQAVSINIDKELTHFTESVDIEELSAWFEARGLKYLSRFEAIEAIFMQKRASNEKFGTAMARIKLPAETVLAGDNYQLHPIITDSGFRIAEAIFREQEVDQIFLPFGVSEFICDQSTIGSVWVKVTARQKAQSRGCRSRILW